MPSQDPLRSFPHLFRHSRPDHNHHNKTTYGRQSEKSVIPPHTHKINNAQRAVVKKARITLPMLLNDAELAQLRHRQSSIPSEYNLINPQQTQNMSQPIHQSIPRPQSRSNFRPIFVARKDQRKSSQTTPSVFVGGVLYPSAQEIVNARNKHRMTAEIKQTCNAQQKNAIVSTTQEANHHWSEFESHKRLINERISVVANSFGQETVNVKKEVAELSNRMATLERDFATLINILGADIGSQQRSGEGTKTLREKFGEQSHSSNQIANGDMSGSGLASTVASPRVGGMVVTLSSDNNKFKETMIPETPRLKKTPMSSPRGRPTETYKKDLLLEMAPNASNYCALANGASAELDALWKTMKV